MGSLEWSSPGCFEPGCQRQEKVSGAFHLRDIDEELFALAGIAGRNRAHA
jgi:hypothetical protein